MTAITSHINARLKALNRWLQGLTNDKRTLLERLSDLGLTDEQLAVLPDCCLETLVRRASAWVRDFYTDGDDERRRHEVMLRYYGLPDGEPETLQRIGDDLGVTRERIRQLREKRFDDLRAYDAISQFDAFVQRVALGLLTKHGSV